MPTGHRDELSFSHLDQELFDGAGVTKRQLVDYLEAMADRLVPVLDDRPLSVIRTRGGQPPFMQKNLPSYAPEWLSRTTIASAASRRDVTYAVVRDPTMLLWFANQRAVEYHVTLFRLAGGSDPDDLVMDLDPPEGAAFSTVVTAARQVEAALQELGLRAVAKTSGAKGLHLFVPLAQGTTSDEAAAASRALAVRAERLDPSTATTAYVKQERGGKVFLDSTRSGGATVVAAYSPRARPGAPVSFPIPWSDLDAITPADFTITNVARLLDGADPWADLRPAPQRLPDDLVAEGHEIPVARVAAMHEGKRRARARRQSGPDPG